MINNQAGKPEVSTLSLATPGDLPAEVDQVEVSLSPILLAGDIDKKSIIPLIWVFDVDGQPIQIKDLKAGNYSITVKFKRSANGSIYATGEGRATVEVGKLANAHVSMTKVEDKTGGLVIVPEVGNGIAKPLVCPAIAKAPVCVRPVEFTSGAYTIGRLPPSAFISIGPSQDTSSVYFFKALPDSCEYQSLPFTLMIVPNSECIGKPNYERLVR